MNTNPARNAAVVVWPVVTATLLCHYTLLAEDAFIAVVPAPVHLPAGTGTFELGANTTIIARRGANAEAFATNQTARLDQLKVNYRRLDTPAPASKKSPSP